MNGRSGCPKEWLKRHLMMEERRDPQEDFLAVYIPKL
jgi:hypothetical protein